MQHMDDKIFDKNISQDECACIESHDGNAQCYCCMVSMMFRNEEKEESLQKKIEEFKNLLPDMSELFSKTNVKLTTSEFIPEIKTLLQPQLPEKIFDHSKDEDKSKERKWSINIKEEQFRNINDLDRSLCKTIKNVACLKFRNVISQNEVNDAKDWAEIMKHEFNEWKNSRKIKSELEQIRLCVGNIRETFNKTFENTADLRNALEQETSKVSSADNLHKFSGVQREQLLTSVQACQMLQNKVSTMCRHVNDTRESLNAYYKYKQYQDNFGTTEAALDLKSKISFTNDMEQFKRTVTCDDGGAALRQVSASDRVVSSCYENWSRTSRSKAVFETFDIFSADE